MSLPAPVGYIRQTVWEEDRFLFYSNFLSAKNEKMWFAQTRSPQLARTIVEETGWMASRDTRLSRRALVDVIDSVLACVGEPPLQPLRHHRTVILGDLLCRLKTTASYVSTIEISAS